MTRASVPALSALSLHSLVRDAERLGRGIEYFDKKCVLIPSRFGAKLFADVKGSEPQPYRVSVEVASDPLSVTAECTCKDAESCPVCKHAAAVLVAWSRAPESFVVSDAAPKGGAIKVKEGKTTAADVMKSGASQVDTLLHELGVAGVAAVGKDRVDQIRRLGESFRDGELERLAGLVVDFAHLLEAYSSGRGGMVSTRYADLMADMLLAVRKLGKYIAGEPLEDRYVEELIGRAWKDSEAALVSGLRLVEVSFTTRRTHDDFIVRESRFIELTTGRHYREEDVVSASSDNRKNRKVSYAGSVLEGVSGRAFPGFSPVRLKLVKQGEKVAIGPDAIRALAGLALPGVAAALSAFQEHRRDLLAPDLFPVVVKVGSLFARGPRLLAVDDRGEAMHLCDDPRIEDQLGDALHDGRLCALIGDIGLDAAIPTLWPLASILESPLGIELRTIHDEPSPSRRRKGVPTLRRPEHEASSWSQAARAVGVSPAAIAVGEIREELADCLVVGLAGMSSRAFGSLAPRLRELSFERPAAVLEGAAKRPDPADRLEDVIKVYQALGVILVRLAGATRVDLLSLTAVPGYEGLHVARPARALEPAQIQGARAQGLMNRYEAVLHFARYFEGLPAESIQENIYPAWADGSVGPYVAEAFAARGLAAVDAAARVLAEPEGRMAKITAIGVLAAVDRKMAEDELERLANNELDPTLRVLAEDALDRADIKAGRRPAGRGRRAAADKNLAEGVERLLTEGQKEKRASAAQRLGELGHRGAILALRQAFVGDATLDVRAQAAYALARLGDTNIIESLVRRLRTREDADAMTDEIDIAANALGLLGDVRGLGELLATFVDGYSELVMSGAITMFGAAAVDPLIDAIEGRPHIAKKGVTKDILARLPAERLGESLARRIIASKAAMGSDSEAFVKRAKLYLDVGDMQSKSRKLVARAINEHLTGREDGPAKELLKKAQKALGIL